MEIKILDIEKRISSPPSTLSSSSSSSSAVGTRKRKQVVSHELSVNMDSRENGLEMPVLMRVRSVLWRKKVESNYWNWSRWTFLCGLFQFIILFNLLSIIIFS